MNTSQHTEFWSLYERRARGPIDAACRAAARKLSGRTMDADDLIAWVDTRVWRMLERSAAPTFHDDPTPEQAVERVIEHAPTLARWAYLGLCRKHWRREQKAAEYLGGMSRAERLAAVSTAGDGFAPTEEVKADLDRVRAALGKNLAEKLAASWPEKGERHRVALALGATDHATDELIDDTIDGTMKENTVQQMRSRARKRVAEIFEPTPVARKAIGLLMALTLGLLAITTPDARAGEQSGGRKGGGSALDAPITLQAHTPGGEQSGGRGGGRKPAALHASGEQTGGGRG